MYFFIKETGPKNLGVSRPDPDNRTSLKSAQLMINIPSEEDAVCVDFDFQDYSQTRNKILSASHHPSLT